MKRLSARRYRLGNGAKYLGLELWFNSQRIGLDFKVWTFGLLIMKESK